MRASIRRSSAPDIGSMAADQMTANSIGLAD